MKIIRLPSVLFKDLRKLKAAGRKIGFVPTMGALHEGHLSLIRVARKENDFVVVSIFVNPTQFSPREDLNKYPRTINRDLFLCRKEKVDFVFLPKALDMYPQGFTTYCYVEGLSEALCGKSRPGHFRGVTTIITKLFNIIQPDVVYFGAKDAQQAIIIKKMVTDLNIPVKVHVLPTQREKDGLALSSRNIYLNKEERPKASVLSKSLNLAQALIKGGALDTARIIDRIGQLIMRNKNTRIEYIEIVDSENLQPLKKISGNCLIALAVRIGRVRLIDNITIKV